MSNCTFLCQVSVLSFHSYLAFNQLVFFVQRQDVYSNACLFEALFPSVSVSSFLDFAFPVSAEHFSVPLLRISLFLF